MIVETIVESVRISKAPNTRVVVLKERGGERYTTIWIGPFEAEAIAMQLQKVEIARPLPYDLMKTIIAGLGGEVQRVVVTKIGDIFVGTIIVQLPGKEISFDARASDAINLAVRANAPVFVDESLLMEFPSSPSSNAAQ
ncbi:MAG: bifunctional nuclease family protein [Thermomicrobiales bacterium]